ncbi:MAG: glycoside hydrolase family 3 protein, partial [Bdellovibrionales bacterium]|nr:glycoside hydrolase family 3 protein [Bdellovibrionales bacterium]
MVLILFFYTTSTLANIELGVQESVNQQLQQMSLEEKVGQLFIFGFNGKSYNSGIDQKLKNLHPGALISFSKNLGKPYQIARLNHQLQSKSVAYSHVPLLLMVDQEGGTVTRILSSPRPPSALALGLTKDPALARSVGQVTGNILRFLGFNQNLAPVADLSNPNEKNFIGSRSFGDDPLLVRKMVQSLSVGHLQSLVLPTTKHFPGHGGMIQDSHKTLPIKSITIEELKEKELIPFIPLARNPMLTATMVAHLSLPKIDPTGVPATFSKVIITDILRESLGYKGLVITDDIEMSGARSSGSVGQRAIKALIAGNDMIMVAWSYHKQKEAYNAVLTAVRNGVISEARVNESLQRILYVKQLLNLENQVSPLTMSEADFQIHFRKLLSQQAQLTHRISRLNFQATLEKNDNLRSTLVPSQRVHFFSSSYSIYKNLAESLPNKVRFTRLKRKSPSPFLSMNQKMQNELLIYHVSG